MGKPQNRIEEYQGAPARRGAMGSAMSYWLKEPYYMSKWTYFHRPSVWNAVGGPKGLTWHGLYGFKTLFAGSAGVSYKGGTRSMGGAAKWMLRSGGGLDELGSRFQSTIGTRHGLRVTQGMRRFGVGFQGGGVSGGIRGLGGARAEAAATWISKLFGGYNTDVGKFSLGSPEIMRNIRTTGFPRVTPGLSNLESVLGGRIQSGVGLRELVSPRARRKFSATALRELPYTQRQLFYKTGSAGRSALRRGIMSRGGARLAAAGAVGMNIALFGGILANIAMAGTRLLGDAAWNMQMNQRVPSLEFGSGVNPFPQVGALTERQRAITAIQGSHLNARSSLGNEASYMAQ